MLIVDDEEVIVSMLKTVFQAHGYEVETAHSATAAVRRLAAQPQFDLIITDMRMENDTAGYDVVKAAAAQSSHPLIIILTAFPLLAQQWRAAGAHSVLTKPTRTSELLRLVDTLLQQRRQQERVTRTSRRESGSH